jgi:molybdopterin adenylyltransferase
VEVDYLVVPDEQAIIRSKLRLLADGDGVDLVLTTGGVGSRACAIAPPRRRSTSSERLVPGLAEAHAAAGARARPARMALACGGRRPRTTLILNLPGDPAGPRTRSR